MKTLIKCIAAGLATLLVNAAFAYDENSERPITAEFVAGRPVSNGDADALHELQEKARRRGRIPVLVGLHKPEHLASAKYPDPATITLLQQPVLDRLASEHAKGFRLKRRYRYLASLAAYVDENALTALAGMPEVKAITEDVAVPATLDGTVPLVGADQVHDIGYRGNGVTVAIIDTGVDRTHPFLAGRVVAEYCFSTNDDEFTSTCPNGQETDNGTGSARPCDYHTSCYHGTHVAGIAAGSAADQNFTGVAPDANIIALNVFSRPKNGGKVLARTSDQKAALEKLYELRNSYNIAAANMSLGSGRYSNHCNSDVRSEAVNQLRATGILTVISSGNDGYKNGIGAPACIETAIAVGNTRNDDTVNESSNSAVILDMLAPGTSVYSSYLQSGLSHTYASLTGTSMAAPHVTGAIALIRERHPSWNAYQIETALKSHGPPITNTNEITRRRLDVNAILNLVDPSLIVEYAGCTFEDSRYGINWRDQNDTNVIQWDADIAYDGNNNWYSWYNGNSTSRLLQFTGGTRKIRIRGKNSQGWGNFRQTGWLHDVCEPGGGPHPKLTEEINP